MHTSVQLPDEELSSASEFKNQQKKYYAKKLYRYATIGRTLRNVSLKVEITLPSFK